VAVYGHPNNDNQRVSREVADRAKRNLHEHDA